MKSTKDKYLGMENYSNDGYLMKIVEYNNYNDITVEFAEPYVYKVKSRVDRFIKGEIKNHNAPKVMNIGITGTKYPTTNGDNKVREYQTWVNMIKRCYDEKSRHKNPTYVDCEVCDEWKYYENFYEWIHSQENYEKIANSYDIDKDILCKGNRIYAPDKCVLVPERVNNLLLKSNKIRGDCVIGVFYNKVNGTYIAECGGKNNNVYLGSFATEMEAFNAYKKYKENQIKEVAKKEYDKGTITKKCYEALMNYTVEITD